MKCRFSYCVKLYNFILLLYNKQTQCGILISN
nr:MAG TPA: hypothetical protein [Caudoviricetes sp.]